MTIQDQLYDKVSSEYQARIAEIENLPAEQILQAAHELVTKEDMLMCFDAGEIEVEYARALLALENPLDHVYEQWLEVDSSWYMDKLRNCIDTEARHLLRSKREYTRGYEILYKIEVGDKVFALGYNPRAMQPYSTWVGHKDRKGEYSRGQYFDTQEKASANFKLHVAREQKRLVYPHQKKHQTPDHGAR